MFDSSSMTGMTAGTGYPWKALLIEAKPSPFYTLRRVTWEEAKHLQDVKTPPIYHDLPAQMGWFAKSHSSEIQPSKDCGEILEVGSITIHSDHPQPWKKNPKDMPSWGKKGPIRPDANCHCLVIQQAYGLAPFRTTFRIWSALVTCLASPPSQKHLFMWCHFLRFSSILPDLDLADSLFLSPFVNLWSKGSTMIHAVKQRIKMTTTCDS